MTVTGIGSGWNSTSIFSIGESGEGHLAISDGATITSKGGTIGNRMDSSGTVEVICLNWRSSRLSATSAIHCSSS
ncbi:hypothetical protein [Enterobacter ludwigii]|uniref:hypothetical protein n=1 Tax=Enterobacter ludwigii TaxID=299767 RepID=UPI00397617E6